ncbi:MAG TPA: aminotransferase class I/II-fold pyridoxal phosphate-dependent enzyme, partial [Woeseiaceae bacterium]
DARVRYLCTPNNPTGTVTPLAVIAKLPGVVLLDEAYAAFSDDDHAAFAAGSSSLISVRTMSKAWGLAGLRVGYAIGPAQLVREIEKSRGPYKVSAVAEAAAVAAITNDGAWVADVVAQTRRNRARLMDELTALGVGYLPSAANFVLIRLPAGCNATSMNDALRQRGVAARPFSQLRGVGECLRVTVGPWSMLEAFLAAFAGALEVQVS